MSGFVVAIDGLAGSGKSTASAALAKQLGLRTLDTGATYRAITAAVLSAGIDPYDQVAVTTFVSGAVLTLDDTICVNGTDVSSELRSNAVNQSVSVIAANQDVREILVAWQRNWVERQGGGIVEGRDIGTVVFPDADVKLFLVADLASRGERRPEEGIASVERRDHMDSTRQASPLRPAADAISIDTTNTSVDEVVAQALAALAAKRSTDKVAAPGRGILFKPDLTQSLFYRFCRALVYGFMWFLFHPSVNGPGRVPVEGPVVIAPVHRSAVDFGFSIFLTKRKVFFMTKDQIWNNRLLGKLLIILGAFPVHRESADRSALEHAEAVLKAGGVLVMFPEGTRQSGPTVTSIMEGATFLAARSNATVVPVGIDGSEVAWPKGQSLPRPHRVTLYCGDVIMAPERTSKGRVSRSALRVMTEHLRVSLENSLREASSIARATK